MRALADSNLTRMAELFGNAKGASARTHKPADYEKRMMATQLFLHGVKARALGDVPAQGGMADRDDPAGQRRMQGGTARQCREQPKEGWLVHLDLDLERAAQVNRPCDTSRRPGNSPGQ